MHRGVRDIVSQQCDPFHNRFKKSFLFLQAMTNMRIMFYKLKDDLGEQVY